MSYRWFIAYNVLGAALWILGFTLAGYFFGAITLGYSPHNLFLLPSHHIWYGSACPLHPVPAIRDNTDQRDRAQSQQLRP
jgi:hypothetical protein